MAKLEFSIEAWANTSKISKQAIYDKLKKKEYETIINENGKTLIVIDVPDSIISGLESKIKGGGSYFKVFQDNLTQRFDELKDTIETNNDKENNALLSQKDEMIDEIKKGYDKLLTDKDKQIEEMKKERTQLMNELQRELSKPLFKKLFG